MPVSLSLTSKKKKKDKPERSSKSSDRRRSREEIFQDEFEDSKKGSGGGGDFITFEEGLTIARIMPPVDDEDIRYFKLVGQHYSAPSGGQGQKPVICPDVTYGEDCPICKLVKSLPKSQKDFKQQHAVRRKYFYNLVIIQEPGKRGKEIEPYSAVASFGKKAHNQIMALETDYDDYGYLDNLEEGNNLKITRTGLKLKTDYAVVASPKKTALDDFTDNVEDLQSARADFDDLLESLSSKKSFLEELAEELREDVE